MASLNNLNIEEDQYFKAINEKGIYVGTTSGISMRPMIRSGIDSICLEKVNRPLKKYDCVMYKRLNGKYVMHRIIKIKNGKYIICGDNLSKLERDITDDNIIALLTGFYRKEKYVSIDNFNYKVYYHLVVFFRPMRVLRDFIKRVLRKILNIFRRKK